MGLPARDIIVSPALAFRVSAGVIGNLIERKKHLARVFLFFVLPTLLTQFF